MGAVGSPAPFNISSEDKYKHVLDRCDSGLKEADASEEPGNNITAARPAAGASVPEAPSGGDVTTPDGGKPHKSCFHPCVVS